MGSNSPVTPTSKSHFMTANNGNGNELTDWFIEVKLLQQNFKDVHALRYTLCGKSFTLAHHQELCDRALALGYRGKYLCVRDCIYVWLVIH